LPLVTRQPDERKPFGVTEMVVLREDGKCAYPVVDGTPILLAPEVLVEPGEASRFDLSDARYAEAYAEMEFYDSAGKRLQETVDTRPITDVADRDSSGLRSLAIALGASKQDKETFPNPPDVWIDARYDSAAQWEAYRHIAPLKGKRVLQLGGDGRHAVKFLYAGADEAWTLSPMLGELQFARSLATEYGIEDRLHCVAGIAEELPFADDSFDAIYAGACVHHMVTDLALPECARILRPGGAFSTLEPWRAPFYSVGTRIFGKREPSVHCRPMTKARVKPLFSAFDEASVIHHGSLTRYPLIALARLGLTVKASTAWKINRVDDAACSMVPALRRIGSSVALLGTLRADNSGKRSPPSSVEFSSAH
jgi:SAM-dependent methyltransferase